MFHGYSAYEILNIILRFSLFLGIAFLIDFYVSYGYRILLKRVKPALIKKGLIRLNWLIFISFSLLFILFFLIPEKECGDPSKTRQAFILGTFFILLYIPKLFFVFCMLCWAFIYYSSLLLQSILRKRLVSEFLIKKYFLKTGLVLQLLITLLILHGIFFTSKNIKISKQSIVLEDLPIAFHGFKIVHITDTHFGSFKKTDLFNKSTKIINALQADIVVFTGDMVNNTPKEAVDYIPVFSSIKARHGKYSVLGNHDFGDYVHCMDQQQRDSMLQKLIEIHQAMGFEVLTNKNNIISRHGDSIYIAGVNNIGRPPFRVYGNLDKALEDSGKDAFIILLSHDPDHWRHEVKNGQRHIALTLSGHTHGMQFGINTKVFKWSPVMKRYPYWSGLYNENNRHLYVNQGLGLIGFLGRIGIRPEITEIVLLNAKLQRDN